MRYKRFIPITNHANDHYSLSSVHNERFTNHYYHIHTFTSILRILAIKLKTQFGSQTLSPNSKSQALDPKSTSKNPKPNTSSQALNPFLLLLRNKMNPKSASQTLNLNSSSHIVHPSLRSKGLRSNLHHGLWFDSESGLGPKQNWGMVV